MYRNVLKSFFVRVHLLIWHSLSIFCTSFFWVPFKGIQPCSSNSSYSSSSTANRRKIWYSVRFVLLLQHSSCKLLTEGLQLVSHTTHAEMLFLTILASLKCFARILLRERWQILFFKFLLDFLTEDVNKLLIKLRWFRVFNWNFC